MSKEIELQFDICLYFIARQDFGNDTNEFKRINHAECRAKKCRRRGNCIIARDKIT